ncbi:uncharacterized protein LOC127712626 [Mytilus californianus]|uniref:uncharacterized protein LOC127712626 n=1 Tax=Mytilus californianus TaxID=6549 RepID=UPI00224679BB|nr:uncharacterized protein LOC127712626 [Mytilus californianus]
MSTCANYYCSLCQEDDETCTAVTWCAECEVFLCLECQKHHGRSKTSKHHQVMSLHDYQNLPEFMLNITNNCEDHDQKFELVCTFHNTACCMKCIKDHHNNCKNLVSLDEVVGNIKSSAYVSKVETDLHNLFENLVTIGNFFSENLSALEKEKIEAIISVQNMRQSIDERLNKLEKYLLIDISSSFTITQDTIQKLKCEIDIKIDQIERKRKDFSKMVEFSTDLQAYFGVHEVEKVAIEEEKYINNLKSADNLREKKMNVELSFNLESTTLGKVSILLSPDHLQLKPKGEEAQVHSSQNQDVVFNQIQPAIKQRLKMPKRISAHSQMPVIAKDDFMLVGQESGSVRQQSSPSTDQFCKLPDCLGLVRLSIIALTYFIILILCVVAFAE